MTWTMLARDSARTMLILPTLASVAMIVAAETVPTPAIISRGREVAAITTLSEETPALQSAVRFMQSLTRLYRPGQVGVLGRLLMQSLEKLLRLSAEKTLKYTRNRVHKPARWVVHPVQKLARWLRRRRAPDEGEA